MTMLKYKAFTIIELAVVFIILAIIAALAIPSFRGVINTSYDYAAATELSAISRQAWYLGVSDQSEKYVVSNLLNGAASVYSNSTISSPSGANQLYIVSGASNKHLQVSAGLSGSVSGTGLDLSGTILNMAMMDQARHCVYETYTQGILTSTTIDKAPYYTNSSGTVINTSGTPCKASGSTYSGGGGGTTGAASIAITGAAGDASVNISITGGTLANASSYTVFCSQASVPPTTDTYGTLTNVVTGPNSTAEPPAALTDPSPTTQSGVWTPTTIPAAGTAVSFTVSGLENNVTAACYITATVASSPLNSNVVNLVPSGSTTTVIKPPSNLPAPACPTSAASCAITPVQEAPPIPTPPASPPAIPTNNLAGLTGLSSIASTDPQFNHLPFVAESSDGSVAQITVSGSAGTAAPYNEIPTSAVGRTMFPAGTFCALDSATNLCANPQPNGLAPQPLQLLNGYFYGSVSSSGPAPLIENSFYLLDPNNNSIYRIDPNSYLVNSPRGYVPPVYTLVATLPSTPTGLAGFTCFTSSDSLLPATQSTAPLCLYTSTSSGVYSIQINPSYGSATPIQITGVPGGANSITYAAYGSTPSLAITYPSGAGTYGGDIAYFRPGSGTYLGSASVGNPSGGTSLSLISSGDPLFGNIGGASGLAYINTTNQTVNVASTSSGRATTSVLAGGGTTPPTSSGVACASAQFGSIGALHQHGPLGTLFVTDSHPLGGDTSALDEIVQNAGGSCMVYLVWGTQPPITVPTAVATIAVGLQPQYMAITPNGEYLYVSSNYPSPGEISVISTATNKVVATIPTQGSGALVASPNGAYIYAQINWGISVISTATNTIIASSANIDAYGGITISPNGDYIYFNTFPPGTLSIYSPQSNSVVGQLPVDVGTLDFMPDGIHAYTVSANGGAGSLIYEVNVSTGTQTLVATSPDPTNAAALTPDGKYFYIDNGNQVLNTSNNTLSSAPGYYSGSGMAITPDGKYLYSVDGGTYNSTLMQVSIATNTIKSTATIGPGPGAYPSTIVISPNGSYAYVVGLNGYIYVMQLPN